MYTPSFWEKNTIFSNIDVCIIGSGIVGLNAAIYLKSGDPELNVMVVDRGFLPYGASTRNAGFACFGSLTELLDDLTKESEDEVLKRVEMRYTGLQNLRTLLGDVNIGYEPLGGYELFTTGDLQSYDKCMESMVHFNTLLKPVTGSAKTYTTAEYGIEKFGFAGVNHLIVNQFEGQIDTGKMMDTLANRASSLGVKIINGLNIHALKNNEREVELQCNDNFSFYASRVLVANNGFASDLLPDLSVQPARAQVLITKPIKDLKLKGSFHYEKGFYYFRNVGNRVLLGGGRNLDFAGESTSEFGTTQIIQNQLDEMLKKVILPKQTFEVDMRWSGIMGLGDSKSTIMKKVNGNIYCAVRMGGMGIAIGSVIGEQSALMILKSL